MSESNSSIATEHHIRCKRGDTFKRQLQFVLIDGVTPIDISGAGFRLDVVDYQKHKRLIIRFEADSGAEITGTNELTLSKTADDMKALPAGKYSYDLEKKTDEAVITILKGDFIIEDDMTANQ